MAMLGLLASAAFAFSVGWWLSRTLMHLPFGALLSLVSSAGIGLCGSLAIIAITEPSSGMAEVTVFGGIVAMLAAWGLQLRRWITKMP
jgi:hypothetical protein